MIGELRVLAVVPARGGSKGVPNKNVRQLVGRPLLAWTLDAAAGSRYLDKVVVSSDDPTIIEMTRKLGGDAPFVRPAALARDETPGIEPILHALQMLPGYDLIVVLQPTSPLRQAIDIDGCLERLIEMRATTCVAVTEAHNHPYWTYLTDRSERLVPFVKVAPNAALRRQDLPRALTVNGAVYVSTVASLLAQRSFLQEDTVAYEMPAERSLDIDTLEDFAVAERAVQERHE